MYNEQIANRIRNIFDQMAVEYEEKKMFGGLSFMVNDKMCCGILKGELVIRIPRDRFDEILKKPHVREMDFTGRTMKSLLYIEEKGFNTDKAMKQWLEIGLEFVNSPDTKPRKKSEP